MKYLQHRYTKIIIAVLLFGLAIYQFFEGNIGNGIMFVLLSGIPIIFYFRNEFIILAFLKLRKQDFNATQKWLSKITDPETALVKKQQGYYNYLHGIVYSQINLTQSEKYFRKALDLGLNMSYDVAMAKLSLAGIMMQKRRKREAQDLLAEAKKLDKQNMMTEQIKMMQQQLKKI